MKNAKSELEELKVQNFITLLDQKEKSALQGGNSGLDNPLYSNKQDFSNPLHLIAALYA